MSAEPAARADISPIGKAPPAIVAADLRKSFGHRAVLNGVDLRVRAGRTLAILGPNGTGKTTLLRILATLTRPSSGSLTVAGIDALRDPIAVRRRIGVVFSATFLYDELTGEENLRHYARLYGLRDAGARIADLAELVGLRERLGERVDAYSRGMAQRLSIARALLHRPEVLLLDEPDAGLDPAASVELPRLLRGDGAAERTIVLTCHDLHLALRIADDLAIMANGRFTFAAPTNTLDADALEDVYRRAIQWHGAEPSAYAAEDG